MKNNLNNLPIGVIDSGIGGLVVLYELAKTFKNESFLYLGDNGNNPYGNKPISEVERLTCNLIEKLLSCNVKAVVIGCNTVSTNLFKSLKKRFNLPLIPTLPPKKVFSDTFIMCTDLTAKSNYVKKYYKDRIISFPTLASKIEKNIYCLENVNAKELLKKLPATCKKLVLGCTHYSFIEENIKKEINCTLLTPYNEVRLKLASTLKAKSLLSNNLQQNIDFIGDFKEFNKDIYYRILVKSGYLNQKN